MSWIGVLTNAGNALLAEWALGGKTLNISGASVGNGTVAQVNMRQMTALASHKMAASIAEKKKITNGVNLRVRISPAPSSVGAFVGHEIGIWANLDGGANVLLSYHMDETTGVAVPDENVTPEFFFDLICPLALSNDGDLTVTVDSTVHVSNGQFQTAVSEIYTALNQKADKTAATPSADGLMSATDKTKLDGIAQGAEVNQSAFSNVAVGSVTIAADRKTDTLTLVAGSNVTLTPDATNDKVTFSAKDTTYSAATPSADGLMSATDKRKLNGIEAGATENVVSNSLEDTSTTNALSAAQGKALNDALTAVSNQNKLPSKILFGEVTKIMTSDYPTEYCYQGIIYKWNSSGGPATYPTDSLFVLYYSTMQYDYGHLSNNGKMRLSSMKGYYLPWCSFDDASGWDFAACAAFRYQNGAFVRVRDYDETFLNTFKDVYFNLREELNANVNALQDGLAVIVDGGKTSHPAIAAGQYVFVKNHPTLNMGVYKARTAISATTLLSSDNVTADPNGGLNDLQGQVAALNSNKQNKILSKTISATTDATGDVSLDLATETYIPVAFHISGGAVSKSASMLFMQNGNGTNWWIKFVSDSALQNEANKTVEGTLYYFST